ncbi:MAG TPA: hemolysin family protein [Verrucomicrobiae bacterium]|nr:hemolysin family protein [Verrucomicrobiae bacterium]
MTRLFALAVILISAGASFFFALAETALFSLGKWQSRQLAERHPKRGWRVARLLEEPQDLLATMVLGNTFASAAMLAVSLWMTLHGDWPLLTTLAVLFGVTLFVCEVLPKTLAVRDAENWSLRVALPMLICQKITLPLRQVAQTVNTAILKIFVPPAMKLEKMSDADYQELIELAYQQGTLAQSEKEIILQIVSLDRRTVKDVMRPRSQMACVSDDCSVDEMIACAKKVKHRRLPVYDETPDTIVGILNTRALLLDPQIDLSEAIDFPSFVPDTMNLLQLLKSLQRQQRGLAIVLDEFGGTAGLVTTEDILSVVVGSMRHEAQAEGFVMEKQAEGRWRMSGTVRLEDFRREYPALGESPDVETMGGLLTTLLDVVPAAGESAMFSGLKLTARLVDDRHVKELLVEKTK